MTDDDLTAAMRELNVTIGVCGSVSAVAVPHIALWLKGALGISKIHIVATASATRLIGLPILEASVDGQVATDWVTSSAGRTTHVTIAARSDVLIVLPATANFLGKVANGIADDLLTTTVLAVACPVVIVPVMNEVMWMKAAVQRNVVTLRADGYDVVEPKAGLSLATGTREVGSMGDFRPVILAALTKAVAGHGPQDNPTEQGE
ncbi:MAG TPA: flavoprotein [Candidatus Limnocylindrales bacterium]|nr:flavoprotein [Candidatus Limnocylindrales bacterium]